MRGPEHAILVFFPGDTCYVNVLCFRSECRRNIVTDQDYEDAYREALKCLDQAGYSLDAPHCAGTQRVCVIDGIELSDNQVLELWWGEKIANEILLGRPDMSPRCHQVVLSRSPSLRPADVARSRPTAG